MAGGRGAAPKPIDQRRNRSEKMRGEWRLVPATPPSPPVLPPLPKRAKVEGGAWSAAAKRKWAAWRADPASTVMTVADIAFALDTITMYEATVAAEGFSVNQWREIRYREEALAMNPKGKRDQRIMVMDGADQMGAQTATRLRPRLRVVAPDAK